MVCLRAVLGPVLFVLYTTPLSDIIAGHSVNHQLFADDTQLQKSAPLSEIDNLTKELRACTNDIIPWMTENQLKLNDDETEALLFTFFSSSKPANISLPDSITLGCHNISFSDSSVHRFLTEDATKTLVTSYILSWLDYCNSLLVGAPNSVIQHLQKFRTLRRNSSLWHVTSSSTLYTSPAKAAVASYLRAH